MAVTATGRRIRKRKLKADINVVPYIDVMLVLLIIFMVTAPLLNLGTDIHLPDSKAKRLQTPKNPIAVSIYANGTYALVADKTSQPMGADDLKAHLAAVNDQDGGDLVVLINGDRNASYQTIMKGIDIVNAAGIKKISLLSHPQETAK